MIGTGSFARMKAAMLAHVETARDSMFQDATDHVKRDLDAMCQEIKRGLAAHVDEVAEKLKLDYMRVMVGADAQGLDDMSESMLRKNLLQPLAEADSCFAALFPAEDEAPDDAPVASLQSGSDEVVHEDDLIAQQLEGCHESPAASSVRFKAEPRL